MAWTEPKDDWKMGDAPSSGDFNRIEGNIGYLKGSADNADEHIEKDAAENNVHGLREMGVALGKGSDISGNVGLPPGESSENKSIAIGGYSFASGYASTAVGLYSEAKNIYGLALGLTTTAEGKHSVAIGPRARASNEGEGVFGSPGFTNSWKFSGSLTASTKNFEIPHPKPEKQATHRIRHTCVEAPTAGDTLYRYKVEATENNQTIELQLPDYFKYLNKNVDVWINGVNHFGRAYGDVEGDILKITCETIGKYRCLIIGTRQDDAVQNWDIKGAEREVGESWTGETYIFNVDEIIEIEEIREEV